MFPSPTPRPTKIGKRKRNPDPRKAPRLPERKSRKKRRRSMKGRRRRRLSSRRKSDRRRCPALPLLWSARTMTMRARRATAPRNALAERNRPVPHPPPPPRLGVPQHPHRHLGKAASLFASMAIRPTLTGSSVPSMAKSATTTHAPCCSTRKRFRRDALCGCGLSFCLEQ